MFSYRHNPSKVSIRPQPNTKKYIKPTRGGMCPLYNVSFLDGWACWTVSVYKEI